MKTYLLVRYFIVKLVRIAPNNPETLRRIFPVLTENGLIYPGTTISLIMRVEYILTIFTPDNWLKMAKKIQNQVAPRNSGSIKT